MKANPKPTKAKNGKLTEKTITKAMTTIAGVSSSGLEFESGVVIETSDDKKHWSIPKAGKLKRYIRVAGLNPKPPAGKIKLRWD